MVLHTRISPLYEKTPMLIPAWQWGTSSIEEARLRRIPILDVWQNYFQICHDGQTAHDKEGKRNQLSIEGIHVRL